MNVDKPSLAIALMARKKGDDDKGDGETSVAAVASARRVMRALKADDAEAFAAAMKDFYATCEED